MQNKVIRFILNIDNRAHIGCKERESVNMLNVSDRVTQNKLNHVFRIWNDMCPIYLKEKFHRICDTELKKCTRASLNNFFRPSIISQAENTFFYSGIKDWNHLPANIKQIQTLTLFKEKVKKKSNFRS